MIYWAAKYVKRELVDCRSVVRTGLCIDLILMCCAAHIRDPNNVAHAIRNLHIVVHDMNAMQPPATLLSQKMLNDVVSEALPQYTSGADLLPKNIISVGNHDLQLNGESYCLF